MSRMRIITKLRKNTCFQLCTKLLDDLGLEWQVHPPTGKGHPFILIENPNGGDPIKHLVALTPKSYATGPRAVATLRRKLEAEGVI